MLRSSGSATQDVVSRPGEDDLVDEAAEDLRAEPLARQLLLADEDVGSGRSGVADADQRRVLPDSPRRGTSGACRRPPVEQHDVVVGRIGAVDRRADSAPPRPRRSDAFLAPPAADVRTLEPVVHQPQVVGHHRPRTRSQAAAHIPSEDRVARAGVQAVSGEERGARRLRSTASSASPAGSLRAAPPARGRERRSGVRAEASARHRCARTSSAARSRCRPCRGRCRSPSRRRAAPPARQALRRQAAAPRPGSRPP